MERILNLTQHKATPSQINEGVVEPDEEIKARIRRLLTFDELPTVKEIERRAEELAKIVEQLGFKKAMIGGAPYLIVPLEEALLWRGIQPLYAFSKRQVEEQQLPDGTVIKKQIFKHLGFIEGGKWRYKFPR